MDGFPAQTVVNIPYMFSQGAWLNYLTPVFGEPWIAMFEFPLYQWCVALLSTLTSLSIDASGRIVSALFAIGVLWSMAVLAQTLGLGRRFVLIASALWLLAPVVVYWGRSVLIETASVFLAAVWLAYSLSRDARIPRLCRLPGLRRPVSPRQSDRARRFPRRGRGLHRLFPLATEA
jgi:hypothetical protein